MVNEELRHAASLHGRMPELFLTYVINKFLLSNEEKKSSSFFLKRSGQILPAQGGWWVR
jgi:hypothetical protein